jgi:hypothetical protein
MPDRSVLPFVGPDHSIRRLWANLRLSEFKARLQVFRGNRADVTKVGTLIGMSLGKNRVSKRRLLALTSAR